MTDPPGRMSRWGRSGPLLALLVLFAGLTASMAVASKVREQDERTAQDDLDRRVAVVSAAVSAETGRYLNSLAGIAAAAGAFDQLTAPAFTQISAPLGGMHLAGATSVSFVVPATDDQVGSVQAQWRTRGVPDLELAPDASVSEHLFRVFSEPLDPQTTRRIGADAAGNAAPAQALYEARRSGQITASDAYTLALDRDLPADQRQQSFVLAAPVFAPVGGSSSRSFRGWVVMGVRGQDFIGATLAQAGDAALDVTLSARNSDDTLVQMARSSSVAGPTTWSQQIELRVAQRSWRLDIGVVATVLPGVTPLPGTIALGGGAMSVLVAALVLLLATGRMRARAQVATAITELRATEQEARSQAELFETVLHSMADGVGVVDERGEFLLQNPAAKALLGADLDVEGGRPEIWQDHFGLFHLDGVTPFPTDEMPLVRALAGEHCDDIRLVVRNANRPDGMVISVSGRPLRRADGRPAAVAVFHDLTVQHAAERALRRDKDHSETIAAVAANIAASDVDIDVIATTITTELAMRIGDQAGFLLFDPPTGFLHVVAAAGRDHTFAELSRRLLTDHPPHIDDATEGTLAHAARTRRTTVVDVPDPAAYMARLPEPYQGFVRDHRVHHLLHVPILQNDRLLGMIAVLRLHPEPFDRHDVDLVEEVAVRAGYAVVNAQLFEQKDRAEAALRDTNEKLERLAEAATNRALRDPLTDLLNRGALMGQLNQALARTARRADAVAVVYLDLDRFKPVNDTLGHAAGDEVLVEIGRRLQQAVRVGDTVARIGGDEFAVVLEPVQNAAEAVTIAERTIALLDEPYLVSKGIVRCGASAGVALATPADTAESLLERADTALYGAKHAARGTVQLFDSEAAGGPAPI